MIIRTTTSFLIFVLTMAVLGAGTALAAEGDATVTIIHGIPGEDLGLDPALPVDVFVSGLGCALSDFEYGDFSPRVPVPPGAYDVFISLASDDEDPCAGPVVIEAIGVSFAPDENASVIAHLTETGGLTASKYTNDVTASRKGAGRLGLHHVAAVGPVDIELIGLFPFRGYRPQLVLEGVANPASAAADLGRGYYLASIAPAGGKPVAYEWVEVRPGKTALVYATGSLDAGTFQLLADYQDQAAPDTGIPDEAVVTVIHGIQGADLGLDADLPVDVFVSDVGCAITDLRFGDIVSRIPLPSGEYDIRISLAADETEACEGPVAVEALGVPFEAGENATVIAHLTADGAPTATKFTNDLSSPSSYVHGRLALHHTAAAGAVDIGILRRFFFFYYRIALLEDVENGGSANLVLAPGRYQTTIAPAGGHPILQEKAGVRPNEATLVYAVGSVANGTFQLIVDWQPLD